MSNTATNGIIKYNHEIKKYNSWRVGGRVKCCYWPSDANDMANFIKSLPATEKIIILGLGSNILFPDEDLNATVIITTKALTGTSLLEPGLFRFEAGVSCAKVAKITCREGYNAGGFFAGIPGTMGGALRMNAGAFGGETWRYVEAVDFMLSTGSIKKLMASEFDFSYRHVNLPYEGWFIASYLRFNDDCKNTDTSIAELLKKRNASQPIGSFNCGSVFKNPEQGYAAQYIESCGLKGKRIGGAVISPKHANFIINDKDATTEDILALMNLARERVLAEHGVLLEPEVKVYCENWG